MIPLSQIDTTSTGTVDGTPVQFFMHLVVILTTESPWTGEFWRVPVLELTIQGDEGQYLRDLLWKSLRQVVGDKV